MKRKVEICVDDLSDQFAKCCSDHDIDDLIDKLNDSSMEYNKVSDEYEELKFVCNKTNGSLSECQKIIEDTTKRYYRYLNGIDDWMGFEELRDNIYEYMKMSYKNNTEIKMKMKFMRKIDNVFLVIAKEVQASGDEELDSQKIKKIKSETSDKF